MGNDLLRYFSVCPCVVTHVVATGVGDVVCFVEDITCDAIYTGLFISPSVISELDCATTKTDTA